MEKQDIKKIVVPMSLFILIIMCIILHKINSPENTNNHYMNEILSEYVKFAITKMIQMPDCVIHPNVSLNISNPKSYINTHTKPFLIQLVKNATRYKLINQSEF
jgi:hypothetical protein